MKVMPNSAMITVTTADSKYSRQTVFGGPCGFTGGSGCLSWPLRLKNRDTVEGFCSAVSGLLVEILLVVRLVAIQKHPRYVTGGGQVISNPKKLTFALVIATGRGIFQKLHPFECRFRRGCLRRFDRGSFPANTAAIPRNLDVENTLMRWTHGFDYCVAGRGASFSLKALLEHCFVVSLSCGQWIGALEFIPQRVTNKTGRGYKPAVEKDRSRDRFKYVREECILLAAATLLFATPESQEFAEIQLL